MITELETKFNKKLDGFGDRFIGMLQGFSILPPPTRETYGMVCHDTGFKICTCAMRSPM